MEKAERNNGGIRKSRTVSFGFTLVELIVVITILAILATIGFIALSGYASDAKDATIKANVRSLQTAIASESAITNNSPRYYVVHDTGAALSGAFVFVDGNKTTLTGGDVGQPPTDSNYTAGNPNYARLKLNPEKFRISQSPVEKTLRYALAPFSEAGAAYDSSLLSVGAIDAVSNSKRAVSFTQIGGVDPVTKKAVVVGNFPQPTATEAAAGAVSGLIRDPASPSATGSVLDGTVAGTSIPAASTGAAVPIDPYWSQVVLGLHMDSLTDQKGKTVTAAGNAAIAASPAKFGSSLFLDGNGDYLSLPNDPTLSMGSGDFTVEGWIYPNGAQASSACVININKSSTGYMQIGYYGTTGFGVATTSVWIAQGSTMPAANAWTHFAVTRSGTTIRVFLNGVLTASATNSTSFDGNSGSMQIGAFNGGYFFNGNVDDVRITKGYARYTADFSSSLPSAPFPNQ